MPNPVLQFTKVLAVDITANTGQIFTVIPDGNDAANLKGAGAWLHIWKPWGIGNRYQISASAPRRMETLYNAPSITVGADRNPEAIAKDVARRLLADAQDYLKRSHEATRKHKEEAAVMAATVHKFSPYLQEGWNNHDRFRKQMHSWHVNADIYPDRVYSLTFTDLPIEKAIHILQYLEIKNPKRTQSHDNLDPNQ